MSAERLAQLTGHIEASGNYPPLIVRPHPELPGEYQLLDGHQRCAALRRLGYQEAEVAVWACTDEEASRLLISLNRLTGSDDEELRRSLLAELTSRDEFDIDEIVPAGDKDLAELVQELSSGDAEVETDPELAVDAQPPIRRITFSVSADERACIEAAIEDAISAHGLGGARSRGRALALLCGFEEAASV